MVFAQRRLRLSDGGGLEIFRAQPFGHPILEVLTAQRLRVPLYCIVLYCIVLYCIVLYCIVLYCVLLYCIVLYSIVLYCIVLYFIVFYCTALSVHHPRKLCQFLNFCIVEYMYSITPFLF